MLGEYFELLAARSDIFFIDVFDVEYLDEVELLRSPFLVSIQFLLEGSRGGVEDQVLFVNGLSEFVSPNFSVT